MNTISPNIRNMMINECIKYWVDNIPVITIMTAGNVQLCKLVPLFYSYNQ